MHKNRHKRNLVIGSLLAILVCMVAGYAAFSTQLEIKGTSKVTSNWDIRITNVTDGIPTGTAENTVAPSWTNLTASMEADLYGKGDAMEYDVTIENKGTIDAKLDDITTNIQNANSDAVNITFSGYTKGEKLLKGESKTIHVKIEYNPNYTGGETSSEVEIDFNYTQNNNSSDAPETYLLTYDYQTNGGTKADSTGEYLVSGAEVNLENTATKEGYTFIGWNTDKDAEIALQNYQMPNANTTLYAIYSKDVKITYQKGEGIESIGKETDTCTLYNNNTSCEITLPSITASSGYEVDGWYNNDTKLGIANDKYQVKEDATLIAKVLEPEPVIQSWSLATTDFHSDTYKNSIVTATFLDNKDVPANAIESWDVSDKKNGSVMAWVVTNADDSTKYDLYIGGNGGVIANTYSGCLFYKFTSLKSIDFGNNFDTSNVTDMSAMFFGCSSLTSLDLSNFDTGNVTNMGQMFCNCSGLTSLDLSSFDTSKVTNMGSMFCVCSGLTSLDVSNFDTSNVTTMSYMFDGCRSLTSLDVSNFDTGKVTTMDHMFSICSGLTSLDLSSFDTSKVTNMQYMFYNCRSLTSLDLSSFDTSKVTYMGSMFCVCSGLTSLDVSNFDTSNVTTMSYMFDGCSSLTSLDVSNFDTSNVTTMQYMFSKCNSLTSLDVSNFDTSNVDNMCGIFYGCSSLTSLDLSDFNTSNVTNMQGMFNGCSSLTSLDVSNFDTSNVDNMVLMFSNCRSLTSLDLSNFDTSNVTDMSAMFQESSGLTKLNLCSFDISKVIYMYEMFFGTTNLTAIYVGPLWTIENVTEADDMFMDSGVSEVTQSDTCEVDAEDISIEIATTSTTNSIIVVASAKADSGITKYEYSKDGGTTWETGTSNTYTFTGLNAGTNYDVKVRVTSKIGKTLEKQTTIITGTLKKPTFTESGSGPKTVTINYPEGCGSTLTCTYQKDNETVQNVTGGSINIEFSSSGSLAATVIDGTNTISSSYTITVGKTSEDLKALAVTTGDGLYADENESGRYLYKGSNPNNYVTFNNETWRIISIEADGTLKIMRNESIGDMVWDKASSCDIVYNVPSNSVKKNKDGSYEIDNIIYLAPETFGCNQWSRPANLNTYLNSTYYNALLTEVKKLIQVHTWGVGAVTDDNTDLAVQITEENSHQWNGNVGLISLGEYIRANSNQSTCGTLSLNNSNYSVCNSTNWMFNGSYWWTLSPYASRTSHVWYANSDGRLYADYASISRGVRPALYLSSDTTLRGEGTVSGPFTLG